MPQKRMRIFAGPNGSGKSSLLKIIPSSVPLGYYINADEVEKLIDKNRTIRLKDFGIQSDTTTLHSFFDHSGFVKNKSNATELKSVFTIKNNSIQVAGNSISSDYAAA